MTADFVVGILEGFEGTLDVVLDRLEQGHLRQEIERLQRHIADKREQFEQQDARDPAGIVVASLNSTANFPAMVLAYR